MLTGDADGSIVGGEVLWPGAAEPSRGVVAWSGGRIAAADTEDSSASGTVIDATGALVLPGIVDLHGDAFERSIMPRGGVPVGLGIALADNDAQLAAAGITTSFLSATDSWEPGLRSREMLRDLVEMLAEREGGPDLRLHVRHERCNTEHFEELATWIRDGRVEMLSYNDHTPGGIGHITGLSPGQVQRAGVDESTLEQILADAIARRSVGEEQERALAELARTVGCVTASHDAEDFDDLERDRRLGVAIVEFPFSIELARHYREAGLKVLLGAPNLVRGASHLGNLSVGEAVEAGVADALCSDYHYPSLLQAPFTLIDRGHTLGSAWSLVAEAPAVMAGLPDRGRLTTGDRADIIVVEPPRDARPARVRASVVEGRLVHASP